MARKRRSISRSLCETAKTPALSCLCVLSALVTGLLLFGCSTSPLKPEPMPEASPQVSQPTPPQPSPEAPAFKVAGTGDLLFHFQVVNAARANGAEKRNPSRDGYAKLFQPLRNEIEACDLVIGNLETPIAKRSRNGRKEFVFNTSKVALQGLKSAGFNVLNIANNHMYDQGQLGLQETIDAIAEARLSVIGGGRTEPEALSGYVLEKNGIRVGVIGFTDLMNRWPDARDPKAPWVNLYDHSEWNMEKMEKAVADLKIRADFVIVSFHWGKEYSAAPDAFQIKTAHRLVEAGADLIVGHHPHVLQPIEEYTGRRGQKGLIAYSLGNLISNMSRKEPLAHSRHSALLLATLHRTSGPDSPVVADFKLVGLWTKNEFVGGQPLIEAVPIEQELGKIRTDLARMSALPKTPSTKKAISSLRKKQKLLAQIQDQIFRTLSTPVSMPREKVTRATASEKKSLKHKAKKSSKSKARRHSAQP